MVIDGRVGLYRRREPGGRVYQQAGALRLLEGQRRAAGRPRVRPQPGATSSLTFWKAPLPRRGSPGPGSRDLPPGAAPATPDCLVQPFADSPVDREAGGQKRLPGTDRPGPAERLYICTPYLILDNDLLDLPCGWPPSAAWMCASTPPASPTSPPSTCSPAAISRIAAAGGGERSTATRRASSTPRPGWCDDRIAAVGTVNLDYRSLYLHFESSALLYGGAGAGGDVRADFGRHRGRKANRCRLGDCRTGFVGTMYSAVLRLVAPLC